jgi:3-isopropylmalate dehydrogenase
MLRHSALRPDLAQRIEAAVQRVLAEGLRTPDIAEPGEPTIGTEGMGDAVAEALGHAEDHENGDPS